jgi:hypothetical protein
VQGDFERKIDFQVRYSYNHTHYGFMPNGGCAILRCAQDMKPPFAQRGFFDITKMLQK